MMNKLSFIPLGGATDVTKNLYLYEYNDSVLIVDCGLGFANETMIGVDLILPDIKYLLKNRKRIVGMVLTHGHEDHIGALPFILPQLPNFDIYATTFTAALANEKLKEFKLTPRIRRLPFNQEVSLDPFKFSLIKITHSVPDTSNIFIKTPIGNFYHGSDFKLDDTPFDGKLTDYARIEALSKEGVICLMSDALGAERQGHNPSETTLTSSIEEEMRATAGKFVFTTYSSNIARQNQVIEAARKNGRQVCFMGRSLIKAKDLATSLGYMKLGSGFEVALNDIKRVNDNKLVLIVAGSQGQENSALSRIASGDAREVKLTPKDTVVFSSDPIPGNELSVYGLIDSISKIGTKVIYSDISPKFHVSGHGSSDELKQMMKMVKPKNVLPIGATYRHMAAYKNLAVSAGFDRKNIILCDDGQEIIFSSDGTSTMGRKIEVGNVYVDQLSGEEVENFVLRDRERLSTDGIVVIMAEVDSNNGQLIDSNIIARGFLPAETRKIDKALITEIKKNLSVRQIKVNDWNYMRRVIQDISEKFIFRRIHRRPLVLPVVIEV